MLRRVLYGLHQAGRYWNARINDELLKFGVKKSPADSCVYTKGVGSNGMIVRVDDIMDAGTKVTSRDLKNIFAANLK
ncbi:hypothetical protein P5V15_002480 [Pogonomyrmex californicus]